jgi:hypothetical protein
MLIFWMKYLLLLGLKGFTCVLWRITLWDGRIESFEVFRNNLEGHYGNIDADYLFASSFQVAYLVRDVESHIEFLDEVPSASKIKKIHVH